MRVIKVNSVDMTKVDWETEDWQAFHARINWKKAIYDSLEPISMDTEAWDLSRLVQVVRRHLPPVAIKDTSSWVAIINHNISTASQIGSDADFVFVKAHPRVCGATLLYYYHRSHPIENLALLYNERKLNDLVQVQHLPSTDGIIVLRAVELARDKKGNCHANPIEIGSDSENDSQPSSTSASDKTASPTKSSSSQTSEIINLETPKYAYPLTWFDLLNPDRKSIKLCKKKTNKWSKLAHTLDGGRDETAAKTKKARQTNLDGWLNSSPFESSSEPKTLESHDTSFATRKRSLSAVDKSEEQRETPSPKRRRPWLGSREHLFENIARRGDFPLGANDMTDEEYAFEQLKYAQGYAANEVPGLLLGDVPEVTYRHTVTTIPIPEWRGFMRPGHLVDLPWSDLEHRIEALPVDLAVKVDLRNNPYQECSLCSKSIHMMPWTRFHPKFLGPLCTADSRISVHAWVDVVPTPGLPVDASVREPCLVKFNQQVARAWLDKHLRQMNHGQRLVMDPDNPGEPDLEPEPDRGDPMDFAFNCWDYPTSMFYSMKELPVLNSQELENSENQSREEYDEEDNDDAASFFSCADTYADGDDFEDGEDRISKVSSPASDSEPPSSPLVYKRHAYSESSSSADEAEWDDDPEPEPATGAETDEEWDADLDD